jgi:hypothetical protein
MRILRAIIPTTVVLLMVSGCTREVPVEFVWTGVDGAVHRTPDRCPPDVGECLTRQFNKVTAAQRAPPAKFYVEYCDAAGSCESK